MSWIAVIAINVFTVAIPAFGWFGIPYLRWHGIRELLIRRRLRKEGRFMPWSAVRVNLLNADGELECRKSSGSGGRFWYWPEKYGTPPAILTDCPLRYWNANTFRAEFPNAVFRETHLF